MVDIEKEMNNVTTCATTCVTSYFDSKGKTKYKIVRDSPQHAGVRVDGGGHREGDGHCHKKG